MVRAISQPGAIQAFEQTPIFARIPGYVSKWSVDIGDVVRKGTLLAELWVPDMVSELNLKKEQVEQAKKGLAVAEAQVVTARALIKEAEASLGRAQAANDFWKGQNERFGQLVDKSVLDKQTHEETTKQFRAATASLAEAEAKILTARAMLQEREATRQKAEVDIRAATAARERQDDLVRYATFVSPYDGVVTRRNINTFDFVQPPTAGKGEPLYVIERRDTMRIIVDVPETDAVWVAKGTKATVRVLALQGREFPGVVARTSYALDRATRTLVAEIDLANPQDQLRPGMYVHATLQASRDKVLTLPASAIVKVGDVNVGYQYFCYLVVEEKVRRTQIEIGARNEQFVEVVQKQIPGNPAGAPLEWRAFTGSEKVVRGNLAGLKDGQAVDAK